MSLNMFMIYIDAYGSPEEMKLVAGTLAEKWENAFLFGWTFQYLSKVAMVLLLMGTTLRTG